jgi:xanthine dehydrogenase small subunit
MSAPIRFLFRSQPVAVPADTPTRTVLQWLREDRQACGTKEGCAEGDCGACTVLVAELPETLPEGTQAVLSAGLALRPVNACIRFLPTLHGKALLTVEDLASGSPADTVSLHPAQQALVDCHGAQCGFCTPGFVMTLAAVHEAHQTHQDRDPTACAPSRGALADALAGNLCRCTGYRPILDAAQQMLAQTGPRLPLAGLRNQLLALRDAPLPAVDGCVHAPRDLATLARLRANKPEARLVAGATDVGLWVTKQMRPLGELIFLGDVTELRRIETTATALRIGAAVTLEDAWAALVARWPALHEMHRRFAGPPVRHAGTLVGNLANGSPIGDGPPVLIALGAELLLRHGEAQRRLPLQDFYLDYMKNALQPGEFVEAVEVPLQTLGAGWVTQAHKISKRLDCDISAVSAGFALRLDGERVAEARLAYGGLAATVRRASGTEAALIGQPWTEATLRAAQAALARDYTPLTDLRASADYRRATAAALLERLWLSTRPHDPVPLEQLRVDLRTPA